MFCQKQQIHQKSKYVLPKAKCQKSEASIDIWGRSPKISKFQNFLAFCQNPRDLETMGPRCTSQFFARAHAESTLAGDTIPMFGSWENITGQDTLNA